MQDPTCKNCVRLMQDLARHFCMGIIIIMKYIYFVQSVIIGMGYAIASIIAIASPPWCELKFRTVYSYYMFIMENLYMQWLHLMK